MKQESQKTAARRQETKRLVGVLLTSPDPRERHRACNAIYKAMHDSLVIYFLRKLGDTGRETHKDLTAETLSKVFKKIHQYDATKGEFTTWVYSIAHNTLVDERRAFRGYDVQSRESLVHSAKDTDIDGVTFELPSEDEGPDELTLRQERKGMVLAAIQRMKNKNYAKALVMRFYQELSYEEISAELGLPMGTVKARISYAKNELALLLDPAMIEA